MQLAAYKKGSCSVKNTVPPVLKGSLENLCWTWACSSLLTFWTETKSQLFSSVTRLTWCCPFRQSTHSALSCTTVLDINLKVLTQLCDGSTIIVTFSVVVAVVATWNNSRKVGSLKKQNVSSLTLMLPAALCCIKRTAERSSRMQRCVQHVHKVEVLT